MKKGRYYFKQRWTSGIPKLSCRYSTSSNLIRAEILSRENATDSKIFPQTLETLFSSLQETEFDAFCEGKKLIFILILNVLGL